MFEFAEEAFDGIAFFLERFVIVDLDFPIAAWWNDDCGTFGFDLVAQCIGIMAFVIQNGTGC